MASILRRANEMIAPIRFLRYNQRIGKDSKKDKTQEADPEESLLQRHSSYQKGLLGDKVGYIPISDAQDVLMQVSKDVHNFHEISKKKLVSLGIQLESVPKTTASLYEAYILNVQADKVKAFQLHKEIVEELEKQIVEHHSSASEAEKNFKLQIQKQGEENEALLRTITEDLERLRQEEALAYNAKIKQTQADGISGISALSDAASCRTCCSEILTSILIETEIRESELHLKNQQEILNEHRAALNKFETELVSRSKIIQAVQQELVATNFAMAMLELKYQNALAQQKSHFDSEMLNFIVSNLLSNLELRSTNESLLKLESRYSICMEKQKSFKRSETVVESLESIELSQSEVIAKKRCQELEETLKILTSSLESANSRLAWAQMNGGNPVNQEGNGQKDLQNIASTVDLGISVNKPSLCDMNQASALNQMNVLQKEIEDLKDALQLAEKRYKPVKQNEADLHLNTFAAEQNGIDEVEGKTNQRLNGKVSPKHPASSPTTSNTGISKQQLKFLERKTKEDASKIRKLEIALEKAQSSILNSDVSNSVADSKAVEEAVKTAEKRIQKVREDLEKTKLKEVSVLNEALSTARIELLNANKELAAIQLERDMLKLNNGKMDSIEKQLDAAKIRANESDRLDSEMKTMTTRLNELEKLYREEQTLRKRYWNMMEDMKGKIRVLARCRPFASYEVERGCKQCVTFIDDTTLEVAGSRGLKEFVFDAAFPASCSQEEVFEDVRNLIRSAVDGYNVCVFAYGQTGSGKTFTMTGTSEMPGLTPRAVAEIFSLKESLVDSNEVKISCYFIELYLDNLRDLFYAMENPRESKPPKLDIKLDEKKMVYVKGAVVKTVATAQELMFLFESGNRMRKVGGTKMNSESSRSHSIFSILIEILNKTTQKNSVGKLSLVDLAGSERADKTGAEAERLKEAQSINKSLSALGDVISALSTEEKFIPYRNNRLTQLMQDSLGGNSKTLMFVNISPADYNADETLTSLGYAARVKLITNDATKNRDGAEVAKLKAIIRSMKTGEQVDPDLIDGL